MATRGDYGQFLATTNVWDVSEIYSTEVTSPQFKELLVRLYQNINNQALSVNVKDSGLYDTTEFVNGQIYFSNPALNSTSTTTPTQRQVFRKVINFGALPNAASTSVAHDIAPTASFTFTRIYGSASDTIGLNYIPLPYASPVAADNIELNLDSTNVTIKTGSNRSNFNVVYVIVEYLKS